MPLLSFRAGAVALALGVPCWVFISGGGGSASTTYTALGDPRVDIELVKDKPASQPVATEVGTAEKHTIQVESEQIDDGGLGVNNDLILLDSATRSNLGDESTGSEGFGTVVLSHKGEYLEAAASFEFFGVPPDRSLLGYDTDPIHPSSWFSEVEQARWLGEDYPSNEPRFGLSSGASHLGRFKKPDDFSGLYSR